MRTRSNPEIQRSNSSLVKERVPFTGDDEKTRPPRPRPRPPRFFRAVFASAGSERQDPEISSSPLPPHAVLGINASASAAEARRAWRARALKFHPDLSASDPNSSSESESQQQLLELNEAYATFLKLRGVRSRGAVGKRTGTGEEGEGEEFDDDGDDDPFLSPLEEKEQEQEKEREEEALFLFVDPFSIPDFDPFRWRELQDLLVEGKGREKSEQRIISEETAADVALALLSLAGVSRMPPRSGVALLNQRQLSAVQRMIEGSLERMDFDSGARAVSEALARARVANSGWRRRRRGRRRRRQGEEEEES